MCYPAPLPPRTWRSPSSTPRASSGSPLTLFLFFSFIFVLFCPLELQPLPAIVWHCGIMASHKWLKHQHLSPFLAPHLLSQSPSAQIIINQRGRSRHRLMARAGGGRPVVVRDVRCDVRVRSRADLCWGQRRMDSGLPKNDCLISLAQCVTERHSGICFRPWKSQELCGCVDAQQ